MKAQPLARAAFGLLGVGVLWASVTTAQSPAAGEFIGTTPCGPEARAFLGGLAADAPCHTITWKLVLDTAQTGRAVWRIAAGYGVPSSSNPNVSVSGPKVALEGTLERHKGGGPHLASVVYRLRTADQRRTLSLVPVADGLLHILAPQDRLMVGNDGWSYTLNAAGRAEQPADPAKAADMSYPIKPVATRSSVFAVFTGRTPCRGISRAIGLPDNEACIKVKWQITLNQHPQTLTPTTYAIEGTLYRQQARTGTWRIVRGASPGGPGTMYVLDATPTEGAIQLMAADEHVLFFLDQQRRPLIGSVDYSYTIHRARK